MVLGGLPGYSLSIASFEGVFIGIEEGDRIAFVRRGKEIILQPLTCTLLDLRGSVAVSDPQDFDAIWRQVFAEHA